MNKGGDHDFNIRLGIRGFDQRPGFAMGALFTILTVLGVLFWILLFNREDVQSTRILVVEILVNVITLGLNLYLICRVGYSGFLRNFGATYVLNLFLSVAGLYIAGVRFSEETGGEQLEAFWRFVLFLLMAALMALMPTLIICGLMWAIMTIFGTKRN